MCKRQISRRDVIRGTLGTLYEMSPYFKIPGVDDLVLHLVKSFNAICDDYTSRPDKGMYNYACIYFSSIEELEKWLKGVLFSSEAFTNLNISPRRQKLGQTELEFGVSFCGRGIDDLDQEDEFVDLDAALRNIAGSIWALAGEESSCFLCKYSKEYESLEPGNSDQCKYCLNNKKNEQYKVNYETHPWAELPMNSEEYQKLVAEGKIEGPYI